MRNERDCSHLWSRVSSLPLETILDYWCERDQSCREAKKFAIIEACENEEIEYTRTDGKTFEDPVLLLANRDILAINRRSFEEWASQFETKEVMPKPLTSKEENNLLKIIGALIQVHYDKEAYKHGTKFNASAIEIHIMSKLNLRNGSGLQYGTIRKKIPAAIEAIKENLSLW